MALQLNNGLVFLHIPKTGGQTIRKVLQDLHLLSSPDDMPVINEVGWPFRNDTTDPNIVPHATYNTLGIDPSMCFAFVRHPLDWYRSQWAFTMSKRGSLENFLALGTGPDEIDSIGPGNFVDWVEMRLQAYPEGMVSKLYYRYTDKILFVGRFERLKEDLEDILAIEVSELPKINGSDPKFLNQAIYPKALAERTAEIEHKAMDHFGYSLSEFKFVEA